MVSNKHTDPSAYSIETYYNTAGNSTYAAITAVALANVVLVTFIVMSVLEEKRAQGPSSTQPKLETKKTQ